MCKCKCDGNCQDAANCKCQSEICLHDWEMSSSNSVFKKCKLCGISDVDYSALINSSHTAVRKEGEKYIVY